MNTAALQPGRSGVYASPRNLAPLEAAAAHAGLAWLTVDLAPVRGKVGFLAACARDLRFPEGRGGNWDAFADCVQDFSWVPAPGYVVRFAGAQAFAEAARGDFATALEILRDAASYWKDRGKTFVALIDGSALSPLAPV